MSHLFMAIEYLRLWPLHQDRKCNLSAERLSLASLPCASHSYQSRKPVRGVSWNPFGPRGTAMFCYPALGKRSQWMGSLASASYFWVGWSAQIAPACRQTLSSQRTFLSTCGHHYSAGLLPLALCCCHGSRKHEYKYTHTYVYPHIFLKGLWFLRMVKGKTV